MKKYYYLFYRLYKYYQRGPSVWQSDWKASVSITVLITFLLMSLIIYYRIYINPLSKIGEGYILPGFAMSVFILNYFIFNFKDNWKTYVQTFEKETSRENKIGQVIVSSIIFLILLNFIVSMYLFF